MLTASLVTGSRSEDRNETLGDLGDGSFRHVCRARQHSTGQSVASTLLSPRQPGLAGVDLEATEAVPLVEQMGG